MRILKIPSVVEFHLKDKVEDFLAKELFQISRNLGSRFQATSKIQNLEASSNFLNHQFDRLRKYAKSGEIEKFDYLARILLRKSMVYRIYALNHVFPNYQQAHATKFMHWLEEVERLASTQSNEFVYKRQWIDKKPGDFGRPLGVPQPAHRIYDHMIERIIEAYLCGTDQYTNNQHGGTPGRGTLTYIQELAKKFLKYNRIYEFDLKGYFDHLSHKSIIELFQSKVIIHYLTGMLKATPTNYVLPPENSDEALKKFKAKLLEDFMDDWGVRTLTPEEAGFIGIHSYEDIPKDTPIEELSRYVLFSEIEAWDVAIAKVSKPKELATEYKTLMEPNATFTRRVGNSITGEIPIKEPTQKDREIGRDKWKDLDLPEQGVPQGSSVGPVLSSVLLGKIMPKDSLLYMDDGIVFMKDTDLRDTETMNERYNRRVSSIMCEVNKEKSRVLETSDLLTKGLKIIGTRWQRVRTNVRTIWSDSMLVKSETRKGISRLLFKPGPLETEKIFAEFLNNGLISPSKRRLLRWYIHKGKLTRIISTELFSVASRIKILGNILTRAYSPESDLESMKQEIELGIFKAELKLRSSRGSLGERVINGCKTILLETTEGPREVKPNIYNVRAICNDVLLRYLKGERPIRSLQVQGMRKPWAKHRTSKNQI